jgi:asparagine synthase (glutamine-hydrolysing)
VPRALVDRPKMGFSPPVEHWLRGPLKGWATDLLFSPSLHQRNDLHVPVLRRQWDDFQAGRNHSANALWAVLMYQAWKSRWLT